MLTAIIVTIACITILYVALAYNSPRRVGFKHCPRHGWVMTRRSSCPICRAYGRYTRVL